MGKKARDIAALAGLAGLAYAYNKNKGNKDNAGEQKTSAYASPDARTKPSDKSTNESSYTGTTKNDSDPAKNIGFEGGTDSDKNLRRVTSGAKSNTKPRSSGMTKAQNDALANANKQAKMSSENDALAKVNRGMGREVTEAAKANATPASRTSKVEDAAKTVAKAAVQGPAAGIATAAKPVADKATNAVRETYRDLSGKVQYKTPDIPSAAKTVSDTVSNAISKPFRAIREAGNRDNPDVKMAKGGMTASRRGDGIATKGKTRGRIC